MELLYSVEDRPMGTGGAVRLALPQMDGEEILVLNGDSFCPWEALPFLGNPLETALASLLLVEVPDVRRFGSVSIQESGKIKSFLEKGAKGGSGLINAGVYRLRRNVLLQIPRGENISLETQVFPRLARAGLLSGQVQHLPFIDIGTPESYARAESFFSPEPWV
jgi:NDP-sugar pyrophosphorylase family protein